TGTAAGSAPTTQRVYAAPAGWRTRASSGTEPLASGAVILGSCYGDNPLRSVPTGHAIARPLSSNTTTVRHAGTRPRYRTSTGWGMRSDNGNRWSGSRITSFTSPLTGTSIESELDWRHASTGIV